MEDRAVCYCPLLKDDAYPFIWYTLAMAVCSQSGRGCSFLGVYDGHEGSDASQLLANKLHKTIQNELHSTELEFSDRSISGFTNCHLDLMQ